LTVLTLKDAEHDARGSSLLVVAPARHLDSGEPPLEDPDHDMEDQAVLREDREMEINTAAAAAKTLQGQYHEIINFFECLKKQISTFCIGIYGFKIFCIFNVLKSTF
jgi:hypothetical protein